MVQRTMHQLPRYVIDVWTRAKASAQVSVSAAQQRSKHYDEEHARSLHRCFGWLAGPFSASHHMFDAKPCVSQLM